MARSKRYSYTYARQMIAKGKKKELVTKKQMINYVGKQIEPKGFISAINSQSATTVGAVYDLFPVAQGDTTVDRTGDEIKAVKINFKYDIQVGAPGLLAAADQYNSVRVIIFKYKNSDGLFFPTVPLVLTNTAPAGTLDLHSFDNREYYHIVYDRTHTLFNTPIWNGAAVTWQHGVDSHFESQLLTFQGNKIGGKMIHFDANGIAGTGKYFLLLISDSAFTPDPVVQLQAELIYKDG